MRSAALLVLVSSSLIACAGRPPPAETVDNTDFHASVDQLLSEVERPVAQEDATSLKASDLCDYLLPLAGNSSYQHPYYFAGASIYASAITGPVGGINAVYDLYNHQAAMFYYSGHVTQTSISLGETNTAGIAFSERPAANVLGAWSGAFEAVGVSLSLPFVGWFSVNPQYFTNQAGTLHGVSASLAFSGGLTLPINLSDTRSNWTPFDNGTQSLQHNLRLVAHSTLEHGKVNGKTYEYLQFSPTIGTSHKLSAVSLGKELVKHLGANSVNLSTAGLALALGVWRDSGKTIQQLCK